MVIRAAKTPKKTQKVVVPKLVEDAPLYIPEPQYLPVRKRGKPTFTGYRRENGRVGVRNHVLLLPLDDLSNASCEAVANNIKGTLAVPHPYGRLQFGEDLELHFRTLDWHGYQPERRSCNCHRYRKLIGRSVIVKTVLLNQVSRLLAMRLNKMVTTRSFGLHLVRPKNLFIGHLKNSAKFCPIDELCFTKCGVIRYDFWSGFEPNRW